MSQNYSYTAKDPKGKTISGTMQADSQGDVVFELRRKNLIPVSIQVGGGKKKLGGGLSVGKRGKENAWMKAKPKAGLQDVVLFTRQLSTMLSAGIPMLESLEILADQTEHPGFKRALKGVVEDVRTGQDFSNACAKYPACFSDIYVSMIRAGEVSGQIDVILERLAEYVEAAQRLKNEIKSAMTYPVISLVLVIGIAAFLMIGIVPQFKPVFESLEVDLPGLTQVVMDAAFFCKNNWYLMLGGGVAAFFALLAYKKTPKGAYVMDSFMLKMPIFGPLFQKVAIARFSRTFSTLIKSGVPILAAMEIVSDTAGNRVIKEAVENAKESVKQGDTLSDPLAESPIFPPMVTKMIGIGERSGSLETLLEKIAVFYDEQVETSVKSLTSMIEPIMIAFMGFIVGGIVLAVFLPIFKLQEKLSG
ncbi:MAG TPA: type II secretion system F family protein [Planctomycetes bacterium]|nr:type II secretion system F family protein [Planctomycetota bacterium]